MEIRKNYGNNGIYGRGSNFFGTSCLDPVALSLRSGKITRGHAVRFVALAQPKSLPLVGTSHVPVRYAKSWRKTLNN